MRLLRLALFLLAVCVSALFSEPVYIDSCGILFDTPEGWKPGFEGDMFVLTSPKGDIRLTIESISTNGAGKSPDERHILLEWLFRQKIGKDFFADDIYEEETAGLTGYAMTGMYYLDNGAKASGYCGTLDKKERYILIMLTGIFQTPDDFRQTLSRLLAAVKDVSAP